MDRRRAVRITLATLALVCSAATPIILGGGETWGGNAHPVAATSSAALPSVLDTIFMVNGTHAAGNVLPLNGFGSVGAAYDPTNREVLVAQGGSSTLLAIDTRTDRVVDSANVSSSPRGVVYDGQSGNIYVPGESGEAVSVINATTFALVKDVPLTEVVANVTLGCEAEGITADPVNGEIYVATPGCHGVTVLSGTSLTEIGSISTDSSMGSSAPAQVAADTATGAVYVGGYGVGGIDVINSTTNQVVTTIAIGLNSSTSALAFDPRTGDVYDAEDNGVLHVISGRTNQVLGSIRTGVTSTGIAFDPSNANVYLANPRNGSLTVIDGANQTVVGTVDVPGQPNSVAFGASNGTAYVVDGGTSELDVVNVVSGAVAGSIPMGVGPNGLAFDPATGSLLVQGASMAGTSPVNSTTLATGASVQINGSLAGSAYDPVDRTLYFPGYPEPAYPNVPDESVGIVNATTFQLQATIVVGPTLTMAVFDPANSRVYAVQGPAGCDNENFVVGIDAASHRVVQNISLTPPIDPIAYDPTNDRLYVGNLTSLVALDPATGGVVGSIPIYWEPQYIGYDPVNGDLYVYDLPWPTPGDAGGAVTIVNASTGTIVANITVGADPVGLAIDATDGLVYAASASSNMVSVIDAGTNTLLENLSVGWDPLAMAYDESSHLAFVANYNSGTVSVIGPGNGTSGGGGSNGVRSVTFRETGLASGTHWSVTLGGTTSATDSTSLTFTEPESAGIPFEVGTVAGFRPIPNSGEIVVGSSAVTQWIEFLPVSTATFPVRFVASALGASSWWEITLGTETNRSTGSTISFELPNGTGYNWTASESSCLRAEPASGEVNVSGSSVEVALTIVPTGGCASPSPPSLAASGLPWLPELALLGGAGIAVAAIVAWRVRSGGRRNPP